MSKTTKKAPDFNALQSAALIAIEKYCGKFADRDLLPDGSAFNVDCSLLGSINGSQFELPIVATLTVGHESTKASSSTPAVVNVVAALLGKLNTATRTKAIADIVAGYAETGDVDATSEMIEMAEELLASLRQSKQVTARGAVKVNPATKVSGLNWIDAA